jgi:DNA-binding winged helix-turn-helix (wHTH) protein
MSGKLYKLAAFNRGSAERWRTRARNNPKLRFGPASGSFRLQPPESGNRVLRFADFEIDVAQRELRRGGEIVHTEPQVFDLLLHLVRHRQRIVGKDELIETIWNGRIVSEAALSSRIRAVRKAIGDNGDDQRFIRTLHKRGFRFVAAVTDGPPSIVEPAQGEAEHGRGAMLPNRPMPRPGLARPRLRFCRSITLWR